MGDNQEVMSDAEPARTIEFKGVTAINYTIPNYTTMHEESRAREAAREHAMNQPLIGMTTSPLWEPMEVGLDVSQVLNKWSGSSSLEKEEEEEEEEEVPPLEGDPPTARADNLAAKTEEEVKVIGDAYMSYLKNQATVEAVHHGDSPPPLLSNQEEEEEEEEEEGEERLPLATGGSVDP